MALTDPMKHLLQTLDGLFPLARYESRCNAGNYSTNHGSCSRSMIVVNQVFSEQQNADHRREGDTAIIDSLEEMHPLPSPEHFGMLLVHLSPVRSLHFKRRFERFGEPRDHLIEGFKQFGGRQWSAVLFQMQHLQFGKEFSGRLCRRWGRMLRTGYRPGAFPASISISPFLTTLSILAH